MPPELITPTALKELVADQTVRGVRVLGDKGGYLVMVKSGRIERTLAARSSKGHLSARKFSSLDSVDTFLRTRVHITQYDVNSQNFEAGTPKPKNQMAAERLKRVHEAAAYDAWFRAEVDTAIKEADDPRTKWVSHEEVMEKWAKRRARLNKKITATVKAAA